MPEINQEAWFYMQLSFMRSHTKHTKERVKKKKKWFEELRKKYR